MNERETLTTAQLARRLNVATESIRRWVRAGKAIPGVLSTEQTPGGHLRFVVEVRP